MPFEKAAIQPALSHCNKPSGLRALAPNAGAETFSQMRRTGASAGEPRQAETSSPS